MRLGFAVAIVERMEAGLHGIDFISEDFSQ